MADAGGRRPATTPDELLLVGLVLVAALLAWSTGSLIIPYPFKAPWYESSALFPRITLGMAMLGGLMELLVRRRGAQQDAVGTEELDSSAANLWQAGIAVCLFVAYALAIPWLGYATCTLLFVSLTGWALGLRLRELLLIAVPLTVGMWLVFVLVLKVAFGHGLLP